MYNYFPHPSNLRQSSGCVSLLIEEGFAGYGIFMAVLEVLRDAPGQRYASDPKIWKYILHADDISQVERVLNNFGLFDLDDDGLLYSPWLNDQLGAYSEKKAKLQEAGRRGAAKRWASSQDRDGQAIASPSLGDGQAIAYNQTLPNVTLPNETLPIPPDGKVVDVEYLDMLCKTQPEGHAPGYVAQVCLRYKMKEATCEAICEASNNAETTNPLYKKFVALTKRIEAEKFTPNHPDNFFLAKLFG